jgi:hypothetical protein
VEAAAPAPAAEPFQPHGGVGGLPAPEPDVAGHAGLAVEGEPIVGQGALDKLLGAGRVDALAVVFALPLVDTEAEILAVVHGDLEVEQRVRGEVVFRVDLEPLGEEMSAALDAAAVQRRLGVVVIEVGRRGEGGRRVS